MVPTVFFLFFFLEKSIKGKASRDVTGAGGEERVLMEFSRVWGCGRLWFFWLGRGERGGVVAR